MSTEKKSKKDKKQILNEKMEELVPVFKFKPMSNDSAICKYIGTINYKEELYDEPLDITGDVKNTVISLGKFGNYDITVKGCSCNVVANYLLQHKKMPIYYTTILYDKRFVSGYLFTVFYYFEISEETSKELTDPKKFINKYMKGKFTIELVGDDGFLEKFLEAKKEKIEEEIMKKYATNFLNLTENDKQLLMTKIEQEILEKIIEFRKLFDPIIIEYIGKKNVINKLLEVCKNDLLIPLIEYALELREKERIDKTAPDQDFKIPDKILNLKKLKDNPDTLDDEIEKFISDRENV